MKSILVGLLFLTIIGVFSYFIGVFVVADERFIIQFGVGAMIFLVVFIAVLIAYHIGEYIRN